ncbi:hypothetical protein D3OALGB2SA_1251 [Olavius algarvensis associated proteobacterium Delta 3]|nr:hypothetical protein D3OALGB2SA_1251 [Olavius algarvensis associated proteobacterium Delta 3]
MDNYSDFQNSVPKQDARSSVWLQSERIYGNRYNSSESTSSENIPL